MWMGESVQETSSPSASIVHVCMRAVVMHVISLLLQTAGGRAPSSPVGRSSQSRDSMEERAGTMEGGLDSGGTRGVMCNNTVTDHKTNGDIQVGFGLKADPSYCACWRDVYTDQGEAPVKVAQESMLIRSPSLAGMEAKGSGQGGGRRLAGSLSTLLLHSGLQSVPCYSCHRCSVRLGHGLDSKGSVEGLRHVVLLFNLFPLMTMNQGRKRLERRVNSMKFGLRAAKAICFYIYTTLHMGWDESKHGTI
ncbi:hypothetical protein EYF80_023479 [Liparis tanakae]|uniref:Uncharacterized protein n=1 Tax=Liparis tanakae TaxID=230148 RepID=A0A4Z2HLT0_9TELE|nr:hypothetical protein EYF80_023479 [Liparis tanakae]